MAIFDHAIPHPEDGDVKDLTQYTKRKGEHAAKDSGGFADIYEGTLKIESENTSLTVKVALKQLRGGKEVQEKIARRHHREMLIWSKLRHPNILPFLGSAQFGSAAPCFVSPWIAHGDVGAYIKSTPTADRVRIIRGMVQGITYLHTQPRPVVHGDIKGGNILISSDGTAILCDFGLSIMLDTESDPSTTTSAQNGSSRWMAPERLLPNNYGLTALSSRTLAADMFSFAMTSVEILTGDVPFGSNTPKLYAFLEVMKGTRPTIPEPYASESKYESLATAIRTCWREHREERLTAEEVLGLLG
ncbi:kinase-like protein [Calocera cornea HHB12733]|uniref:Kinase-like protein n=1 Tax=Calocera cornea HHB12733 TaxID=1353952 RepID=A0A165J2K5_9BASI|nr:kinase-like protein [Calocera cornea HHB12733]